MIRMRADYLELFKAESMGFKREHPVDKEIAKLENRLGKFESSRVDSAITQKIALLKLAKERLKKMSDDNVQAVKSVKKNGVKKNVYEIDKDIVKELASYGMSKVLIANTLGMSPLTFNKHLEEREELEIAFNKGRAEGVLEVAKLLRTSAEVGNVQAQIFYLKTQAGEAFRETQHIEHTVNSHEEKLATLEAEYKLIEGE